MFEKVCEVITNTLSCEGTELTAQTRLAEDIGADSLDAVELNMALKRLEKEKTDQLGLLGMENT